MAGHSVQVTMTSLEAAPTCADANAKLRSLLYAVACRKRTSLPFACIAQCYLSVLELLMNRHERAIEDELLT